MNGHHSPGWPEDGKKFTQVFEKVAKKGQNIYIHANLIVPNIYIKLILKCSQKSSFQIAYIAKNSKKCPSFGKSSPKGQNIYINAIFDCLKHQDKTTLEISEC